MSTGSEHGHHARQLEAVLRRLAERKDLAHVVMAVERGDGSFRWGGAAGDASPGGPAMREDTPYFIASIDKILNAALVMQFVEEGRIDLDAPVAIYLPATHWRGLHQRDGADHSGEITVRHLLSHTSGLADWLEDCPRDGRSLVDRLAADGDFSMTIEEIADYVRRELRPHFPPQAADAARPKARYSDTNFILLAAIIEHVEACPLPVLHETRLYQPLGMQRTWMEGHSTPAVGERNPASLWFGPSPIAIPAMMRSFRGVYSTAGDQLRFLRALVGGELFASPDTWARMQQPCRRFGLPLDAAAFRAPSWPLAYGLGVLRFELPRLLTPFRAVPALVGHSGSTGSWLFHCPELDLFLAGTVDQATAGAVPYRTLPAVLRIMQAGHGS